jgi:hypothetical protein
MSEPLTIHAAEESDTRTDYQRVCIPAGDGTALYGFVQMDGDEPVRTYACSMTPCAWVEAIGFEYAEPAGGAEDCAPFDYAKGECGELEYGADSGYHDWREVKRNLCGPIFDAEDLDEAREECSANWATGGQA